MARPLTVNLKTLPVCYTSFLSGRSLQRRLIINDQGFTPGHFAPKMARLIQKNAITRLRS